ncbi:hypothetical protein BGX31_005176, partial [Mortierella sp. GBA43]
FQDDDNDVRLDIAPAPPEIGGDQPLQGLMDDLNTVLDEKNKRTVCESFETDFSIHEAGNELGIAPADRIVHEWGGYVRFIIMDNMFNLWREEHEVAIGCKFSPKEMEPMTYKERPKFDAKSSWTFH